MIRKVIAFNRRICSKIEDYLPQTQTNIFELYERTVGEYMNAEPSQLIVDVGGGKSCSFAKYKDPEAKARISVVDISEEELRYNTDVEDKRVADITQDLPYESGQVDLLVSRSVLEHLEDLERFAVNSKRVLKPGGYFIHLFPSRFAPFALMNQALPHSLSQKVLYFFDPESKGICGFPAVYDHCYYSGISRLLERNGFKVVRAHMGYYQSRYFSFFVPLFLVSAVYEMLIRALGIKNLAAYVLVVARIQ